MRLLVFTLLFIFMGCGLLKPANAIISLDQVGEIPFWEFYKLSDGLYRDYIQGSESSKYKVDVYLDLDLDEALPAFIAPWHKEDSLGIYKTASLTKSNIRNLLQSDKVLVVKKAGEIPGTWIKEGERLFEPKFAKWLGKKDLSTFYRLRESTRFLSDQETSPSFVQILYETTRYFPNSSVRYAPYGQEPQLVSLDSEIAFRVRIYFTRSVPENFPHVGLRSGVNSLDAVLKLSELVKVSRRVDVAFVTYIYFRDDLPDLLKYEFTTFPSEYSLACWQKLEPSLCRRILFNNYRSEMYSIQTPGQYQFNVTVCLDSISLASKSSFRYDVLSYLFAEKPGPTDPRYMGHSPGAHAPVDVLVRNFKDTRCYQENAIGFSVKLFKEEIERLLTHKLVLTIQPAGDCSDP